MLQWGWKQRLIQWDIQNVVCDHKFHFFMWWKIYFWRKSGCAKLGNKSEKLGKEANLSHFFWQSVFDIMSSCAWFSRNLWYSKKWLDRSNILYFLLIGCNTKKKCNQAKIIIDCISSSDSFILYHWLHSDFASKRFSSIYFILLY